jgi:hypothetical protein
MNKIKVGRMLLAALAMLVMWIALEVLVEGVIADLVLGQSSSDMWRSVIDYSGWSGLNAVVSTFVALWNCAILIWLYASLRPMYGVGTKTALITCAFGLAWIVSIFANMTNLGLIPPRLALIEFVFEAVEFPIAMLIGAGVYEGKEEKAREAG